MGQILTTEHDKPLGIFINSFTVRVGCKTICLTAISEIWKPQMSLSSLAIEQCNSPPCPEEE